MSPDEHRSDGPLDDVPEQDLPPPTPFDRPSSASAPSRTSRVIGVTPMPAAVADRAVGRGRLALLMLVAAAIGFVAGLAAPDSLNLPGALGRDPSVAASERDAGLVVLLELITRTEGEMLAFNDAVGERLRDAEGQEEAFAAIADAAAEASDGLTVLRPTVVEQSGHPSIDDVRTAYLPHLDSWIDYLTAVAERPALLFTDGEQQPYLLLINATAAEFADALEALLATDPAPEVAELAERILDDGFRGMGTDAQV